MAQTLHRSPEDFWLSRALPNAKKSLRALEIAEAECQTPCNN
jgi:hypothetical protein